MYPVDRIQMFDKNCQPMRELAPDEVLSRVRHEVINGEHSLTIETTRRLSVGDRALTVDGTGKWREWVVEEPDETHEDGASAIGTYRLVWSMQYDLTHTYDDSGNLGHIEVGMGGIGTSRDAVEAAIRGSSTWTVGTCDVAPVEKGSGVVMIASSAWDRLKQVAEKWGGEIDAQITVGIDGVTSRKVCLLRHLGSEEATRRFDWGVDLTSISRKPDPGPYYCRVVPIGKGQTEYAEDDETEFEWPMSLLDDPEYFPTFPDGSPLTEYIQDDESALVFRVWTGSDWEYPYKVVKYDEDDVELLYNTAMDDLHNHTRPNVTYRASVIQLAKAGMDVRGVALGDEVQCVDRGFNPDHGLAIQERVMEMTVDELDDDSTELVIGDVVESVLDTLADVASGIDRAVESIEFISTDQYVHDLLDRLNAEINATGGYAYLVEGEGLLTYDVAVSDPAVGSEASMVVQIKGGSIRIANSRKANGDWDWKSVFVSGHIVSELVTACQLTSGYIGNPNGNCWWNLDSGELVIGDGASIDGRYANVTHISGGSIETNAISARHIASNTITADLIDTTDFNASGVLTVGALASSLRDAVINGTLAFDRASAVRGVCATPANESAKAVRCPEMVLESGAAVTVYNETAQTYYGKLTLNVNLTGAKDVWVAGYETSDTNRLLWTAGSTVTFVYDGFKWWVGDYPGKFYADETCDSGASASAKVAVSTGCVLFRGAEVVVPMANENTAYSATLNVSGLGAASIYYGDGTTTPMTSNGHGWVAGGNVPFTYDGRYWRLFAQTFIDGDHIITGTIDTARLNADTIKSRIVQTTELNADMIKTGTLEGITIKSVTPDTTYDGHEVVELDDGRLYFYMDNLGKSRGFSLGVTNNLFLSMVPGNDPASGTTFVSVQEGIATMSGGDIVIQTEGSTARFFRRGVVDSDILTVKTGYNTGTVTVKGKLVVPADNLLIEENGSTRNIRNYIMSLIPSGD